MKKSKLEARWQGLLKETARQDSLIKSLEGLLKVSEIVMRSANEKIDRQNKYIDKLKMTLEQRLLANSVEINKLNEQITDLSVRLYKEQTKDE